VRPWRIGASIHYEASRFVYVEPEFGIMAAKSKVSKALWTCPTCARTFAKGNQWHSCQVRGVDSHFVGRPPRLKSLFDLLIRRLQQSGPLSVDAVKSSINLISVHHFGGVTVRDDGLRVGFLARDEIKDRRIVWTQRIGPNRVAHRIMIRSREEIDAQLLGWLGAARALQARGT
jgi:hypothetical protein